MRKLWLILIGIAIGIFIAMPFHWRHRASMPQSETSDALAEQELNRIIPAVDIEATNFDDAVKEVQKLTAAEISVDWKSLHESGFDRTASVSVHATGIYLWRILERIIVMGSMSVGKDHFQVSYQPCDGRIAISTVDQLLKSYSACIYNVHDLVFDVPPTIFGYSAPPPYAQPTTVDALAKLIQATIAPGYWHDDNAAIVAMILPASDHLYVVQTWANHRQIRQLLQTLRAGNAALSLPIPERATSAAHETWIYPDIPEKLETLLRRPMDRLDIKDVPLEEAIDKLQKQSGVNIWVNWEVLAKANVSFHSPVSLRTSGTSLTAALNVLFARPIDGVQLGFTVDGGIAEISTLEDANKVLLTRLYDVRDFIAQAKPSEADEVMHSLYDFIENVVERSAEKGLGMNIGIVYEMKGRLVILQSWSMHERISAELDALRKSGGGFLPQKVLAR